MVRFININVMRNVVDIHIYCMFKVVYSGINMNITLFKIVNIALH